MSASPDGSRGGRSHQILEAAADLFYVHGFHSVGMDEIGDAVGITGPAIYRHFSGKEEILATLLNDAIDEIMTRVQRHEDPQVELEQLLHSQCEFAVTHPKLVSVYSRDDRELTEPWRSMFARRARRHEEHWIGVLRRCYPDAPETETTWAARGVIGMIHSIARWPIEQRQAGEVAKLVATMSKHALNVLDRQLR